MIFLFDKNHLITKCRVVDNRSNALFANLLFVESSDRNVVEYWKESRFLSPLQYSYKLYRSDVAFSDSIYRCSSSKPLNCVVSAYPYQPVHINLFNVHISLLITANIAPGRTDWPRFLLASWTDIQCATPRQTDETDRHRQTDRQITNRPPRHNGN